MWAAAAAALKNTSAALKSTSASSIFLPNGRQMIRNSVAESLPLHYGAESLPLHNGAQLIRNSAQNSSTASESVTQVLKYNRPIPIVPVTQVLKYNHPIPIVPRPIPIVPHRILALQLGRALNTFLSNDSFHCSLELFIHGYYGDRIVPSGTKPPNARSYNPKLIFHDKELTFRLLAYWPNLIRKDMFGKPIVKPWDVIFHERFWAREYEVHSPEIQIDQAEYFSDALNFYLFVAPKVNPLLNGCCEAEYMKDGKRKLNVNEFFFRILNAKVDLPTLHVHEEDGLQVLRELKFYQDNVTKRNIECPLYRQIINQKNRNKVYPNGMRAYNPNMDLYVV